MSEALQGVAIVGMAGRFPGANSLDKFWQCMMEGVDCTRELSREEVINSGVDPAVADDAAYIKRAALLDDIDLFDAGFFDCLPTEAALMDPQIRLFLECVQHAFDNAGCDPERYEGSIGVYAGAGLNNYLLKNLMRNPGYFEDVLDFQKIIANDKDFLATQVNYKFNLSGPGLSVQTACSTSLVAIQLAYQGLLTYQCDVAISGGTHLRTPRSKGMLFKEGEIYSPDGLCRPFDKSAAGTVFGEGVGVVVLKRLEDALEQRDHIYGVIRGAALNNDGSQKVSYAAPSVKGQAEVIAMAQTLAGVDAEQIGYVEAHGTGTKLGDPVEIRALSQAFRRSTTKKNYCALGSGKSMIGHLDVAAGVAGLMRATLALHHKTFPATLHFNEPNPELKLEDSPFLIRAQAREWHSPQQPRMAAVSSFGVGGTNAHAIIQEAPPKETVPSKKNCHLLTLSAKTATALEQQCASLAAHFKSRPTLSLADAAYTLQQGRRQFNYRRVFACHSLEDAIAKLEAAPLAATLSAEVNTGSQCALFMFSGQGAQHVNMCRDLYHAEPVFKQCIDSCARAVEDIIGFDFSEVVFSQPSDSQLEQRLKQTQLAQPCLYAVECAFAKLWQSLNVQPEAMIGHSIGEFAAAHIAGVFSLADGARIVATRGKLMQQMAPGAMLSLRNAADDVAAVLADRNVSVVVVNGPELTVVGGTLEDIEQLKSELEAEDIPCSVLHTSHAFHSSMMQAAVQPFVAEVASYTLHPPQIPFISNLSGEWITAQQATSPEYWGKHLRSPVQFAAGIHKLCSEKNGILLELGPNQVLTMLCREQTAAVKKRSVIASARHPKQSADDVAYFYRAFGGLWAHGMPVDFSALYADEPRHKIPLPGYAFERQSYWIDAALPADLAAGAPFPALQKNAPPASAPLRPVCEENCAEQQSVKHFIVDLWQQMLGCKQLTEQDNFFDLGGHSLVATQMLSVLQKRIGKKIPIEYLNGSENLAQFCKAVESLADQHSPKTPHSELQQRHSQQWPLSPQQQRLWFFRQLAGDTPLYNLAQTLYLEGAINIDKLRQAANFVLACHESLNTVLKSNAQGEAFAVRATVPATCELVTLTGDSEDARELGLVENIIHKNRQVKHFAELSTKACLYQLGPKRFVLTLFVPHLLTDGLSFHIFYQHLNIAYQNLLAGKTVGEGIDVPYQYSDYVHWLLEKPKPDASPVAEFWQGYLQGVPELIQLPTQLRPLHLSSRGAAIHFALDEQRSAAVRVLCKKLRITPFVFFLSQLYLLLWKYSGQESQVIGAPFANRDNPAIENMVGFFVDMIPIRGDIEGGKSFERWVSDIHHSFSQAWDNFDIGLDKIVEVSGHSRHSNIHPLFQVTFTYLSFMDSVIDGDGYSMRPMLMDRGVSEYDLSLYMWHDHDFAGMFEFASDLFSAQTVQRLSEHYISVIDWVLSGSDQLLSSLNLVDEQDCALIDKVNHTARTEFLQRDTLSLFADTVARYPEKIALRAAGVSLSYKELDNASSSLARDLRRHEISTGDFVGVYTERGLNTVIAPLAIFKSGASYIPLDPGFPEDRLRYIIENSGVKMVLVAKANQHSELLQIPGVNSIVLNSEPSLEPPADFEPVKIQPSDIAYLLYTSGSTGMPKGVPIRHESLANFLLYVAETPGIRPDDKLLALTTTSFDISFLELLLPLISGASVVVAGQDTARDGMALSKLITVEDISYIQATPVTWTLLLDAGWQGKAGLKMLCGGEALKSDLAARLLALGGELWNAYGPTECTIWSSFARIEAVADEPHIGIPMANTGYYIVDEYNQPLPPGLVGELAISGVLLSPGYFNRDELTKKAFVNIVLPGKNEKIRVYKTGDLAYQRSDGYFRCLGRKDFQVKIRGFRIELGEIESQLLSHSLIEEGCCTVLEKSPSNKQIVAYYRAAAPVESGLLREFLQSKLPAYMVPSIFEHLADFPRTANQKVDRKALPAPSVEPCNSDCAQRLQPLSKIERDIKAIWQQVLQSENIGVNDNFFDVGGHSLLAVQVIKRMNENIKDLWQVRDLFTRPNIEQLAKQVPAAAQQLPLVFPAQPKGNKPPFFLVAGVHADEYKGENGQNEYESGFLAYFGNIIGIIGHERPIYGLRANGLFKGERLRANVSIMAAEYVEKIIEIQPDGPYIIGGECLGGNIAYEIASQMRNRGKKVELLVLLDTMKPSLWFEVYYQVKYFARVLKKKLQGVDVCWGANSAKFATKLLRYRAQKYEGRVLLLANEEWNRSYSMLNWSFKALPHLAFEVLKGGHTTRLQEFGEQTGRILRKHLDPFDFGAED
ncbi:MAG: amino acid adenylation domain-containing protein [Cellvibrionaceae bacterium]|nr:amino acid adenylation domain-containing protein [Cellvibrionaceae bacterium]